MSLGCPCGGFTAPNRSKSGTAILTWAECGSCGRAGEFRLHVGGEQVASGQVARRTYQDSNALEVIRKRVSLKSRGN